MTGRRGIDAVVRPGYAPWRIAIRSAPATKLTVGNSLIAGVPSAEAATRR
jgi:hypothetical protein